MLCKRASNDRTYAKESTQQKVTQATTSVAEKRMFHCGKHLSNKQSTENQKLKRIEPKHNEESPTIIEMVGRSRL